VALLALVSMANSRGQHGGMHGLLSSLSAWVPISFLLLVAAVLFIPWSEPSRRVERFITAWRGRPTPQDINSLERLEKHH
jgi:hypothetical protein